MIYILFTQPLPAQRGVKQCNESGRLGWRTEHSYSLAARINIWRLWQICHACFMNTVNISPPTARRPIKDRSDPAKWKPQSGGTIIDSPLCPIDLWRFHLATELLICCVSERHPRCSPLTLLSIAAKLDIIKSSSLCFPLASSYRQLAARHDLVITAAPPNTPAESH